MGASIVADTVLPEGVRAVQALEQRACRLSAPLRDLGRGKIDVPQDLSRSCVKGRAILGQREPARGALHEPGPKTPLKVRQALDRKSTRLNSSHSQISYAVFCLKKKTKTQRTHHRHRTQSDVHPRRRDQRQAADGSPRRDADLILQRGSLLLSADGPLALRPVTF